MGSAGNSCAVLALKHSPNSSASPRRPSLSSSSGRESASLASFSSRIFWNGSGRDAVHHLSELLDKAPPAIERKPRIAGQPDQPAQRRLCQTDVEDGLHHAGHRHRSTRAHRDEEGPLGIAEMAARQPPELLELLLQDGFEAMQRCDGRAPDRPGPSPSRARTPAERAARTALSASGCALSSRPWPWRAARPPGPREECGKR